MVSEEEAEDRVIAIEFLTQLVSLGDWHVSIESAKVVGRLLRDQLLDNVQENLGL